MSKRILLFAIGAVLLFGNASAFADSITCMPQGKGHVITVTCDQNKPAEGRLGQLTHIGKINQPVSLTVTNLTGETWTNYEITFVTGLEVTSIKLLSGFSSYDCAKKTGCAGELQLYGGNVANKESFSILFNVKYANSVNIFGKPTTGNVKFVSPEPASLLLMGTGVLALVPAIRRKLRL